MTSARVPYAAGCLVAFLDWLKPTGRFGGPVVLTELSVLAPDLAKADQADEQIARQSHIQNQSASALRCPPGTA